jgi:hypothetical protein
MDVIERRTHSQRRPYKSWKIPMSSLVDHLNGKIKSNKMGPKRVLIKEEDAILIKWTLDMQECGLSISLQQLKMKVAKLTQTKDTPFQSMEYQTLASGWFKQKHLKLNI